ncbi:uncharacterized protein LOC106085853 [Stomoxys calcitrans]|uniref:Uncharacterized protein n=1 Tax=Stomoxys calcitrans TaxID=35570 RepID=A0A1I8PZB7_STOCA|nr:uncharacterized protein LOC106085853 [Stomoxys calcitrans]
MNARGDYKKKLMEYRRSVRESKCVAFKDITPQTDDIQTIVDVSLDKSQTPAGRTTTCILPTKETVQKALSPSPQPSKHNEIPLENSIFPEPIGKYTNWRSEHTTLASQPWCCVGDLMAFCDKYEFKAVSSSDSWTHGNIVNEVRALLSGKAPFDIRKRFPSNMRSPENLMVCVGRCPSVEYHLGRILAAFRKPLTTLSPDKQRIARQNFHLAVRELRLDISARVTDIRLYDQKVFERDFHLTWEDNAQ